MLHLEGLLLVCAKINNLKQFSVTYSSFCKRGIGKWRYLEVVSIFGVISSISPIKNSPNSVYTVGVLAVCLRDWVECLRALRGWAAALSCCISCCKLPYLVTPTPSKTQAKQGVVFKTSSETHTFGDKSLKTQCKVSICSWISTNTTVFQAFL